MRLLIFLIVSMMSTLAMSVAAKAGDWRTIDYHQTGFAFDLPWDWADASKGSYSSRWSDDYLQKTTHAWWTTDQSDVIEVWVSQLAANVYWSNDGLDDLSAEALEGWPHLENQGVSNFSLVPCRGGSCATFESNGRQCGGFYYFDGRYGDRWKGDKATRAVDGYYCLSASDDAVDLATVLAGLRFQSDRLSAGNQRDNQSVDPKKDHF